MPSKCSETLRPASDAGSASSRRYHHAGLKGLVSGVGMSVKRVPIA